jgi:hypothetical protein
MMKQKEYEMRIHTLESALVEAKQVLDVAGRYFPKSIKNRDRFSLLNVLANAVNPAIETLNRDKAETLNSNSSSATISIPVKTLQEWVLGISQGDTRARFEMEKTLRNNGYAE